MTKENIEFEAFDGWGDKTVLDISRYGNDHIELQIIDKYGTQNEETKFYILGADKIKELQDWLNAHH